MTTKCKFNLSRFQWLNRELIPIESRYMWFKTESRFVQIFKYDEPSDEHLSLMHQMDNLVEDNNNISYDIDFIKIRTQEDTHTMLMIKNIPNKFTKDHISNVNLIYFYYQLISMKRKIMDMRLLTLFIIIT